MRRSRSTTAAAQEHLALPTPVACATLRHICLHPYCSPCLLPCLLPCTPSTFAPTRLLLTCPALNRKALRQQLPLICTNTRQAAFQCNSTQSTREQGASILRQVRHRSRMGRQWAAARWAAHAAAAFACLHLNLVVQLVPSPVAHCPSPLLFSARPGRTEPLSCLPLPVPPLRAVQPVQCCGRCRRPPRNSGADGAASCAHPTLWVYPACTSEG